MLKTIVEKISEQTAKRNAPPRTRSAFSDWAVADIDSIRFRTQFDERIRERVNEEGERIRALILEIRQHIRLVKLHLSDLEGNPESSNLINLSIIGAVLLFLFGNNLSA